MGLLRHVRGSPGNELRSSPNVHLASDSRAPGTWPSFGPALSMLLFAVESRPSLTSHRQTNSIECCVAECDLARSLMEATVSAVSLVESINIRGGYPIDISLDEGPRWLIALVCLTRVPLVAKQAPECCGRARFRTLQGPYPLHFCSSLMRNGRRGRIGAGTRWPRKCPAGIRHEWAGRPPRWPFGFCIAARWGRLGR